MTNREFFTNVINGVVSAEMTAKAQELIEALDKRNDKRRDTPTKEQLANAPIKRALADALVEDNAQTASELGVAVGVSTQKASALLRQLVDEGVAVSETVKVKGKGEVKAYRLLVDDAAIAARESAQ